MQRKFILCPFRNGNFCLLFISAFLNSVYGWTAQNSVINSKNFVQRIFFELLYRVYKISKFLGQTLYECPSIKYAPLEFYTPCCLSLLGYLFDDLFTNNVRTLSSIPPYQKDFMEKVLPEKKSFIDFPLFWLPPKSEVQCLGFNIFLSTCWDNFFTMAQAKTKFKKVLSQTFF